MTTKNIIVCAVLLNVAGCVYEPASPHCRLSCTDEHATILAFDRALRQHGHSTILKYQRIDGCDRLTAWNTQALLTDTEFSPIARFHYLQIISVKLNQDHALQYVSQLPYLTTLSIGGSDIGDRALTYLEPLSSSLEELYLSQTHVSDRGLHVIGTMSRLKVLAIGGTMITDDGLQHLAHLSTLEELHLWGTSITGEGFKYLKNMTRLKTLVISHTAIDDNDAIAFPSMPSLQSVNVLGTKLSETGIATLKSKIAADGVISREVLAVLE